MAPKITTILVVLISEIYYSLSGLLSSTHSSGMFYLFPNAVSLRSQLRIPLPPIFSPPWFHCMSTAKPLSYLYVYQNAVDQKLLLTAWQIMLVKSEWLIGPFPGWSLINNTWKKDISVKLTNEHFWLLWSDPFFLNWVQNIWLKHADNIMDQILRPGRKPIDLPNAGCKKCY